MQEPRLGVRPGRGFRSQLRLQGGQQVLGLRRAGVRAGVTRAGDGHRGSKLQDSCEEQPADGPQPLLLTQRTDGGYLLGGGDAVDLRQGPLF